MLAPENNKLYTIGTQEMTYEELGNSRRVKKGSELLGFSQLAASEM